jgi:hypothetical protein
MKPAGLIMVAFGVLGICGAGFNWEWFMGNRKARFFTTILGRAGARVFYAAIGSALVVFGALVAAGLVSTSR